MDELERFKKITASTNPVARALKIRDKLLKYKDDVSRNIIYLLDEMK